MQETHKLHLSRNRIEVIDVLRGIVMIIMALDHTRDFFTNIPFKPNDLTQTSIILFFTRWITHFCAPIFVFLVGTSMFLYVANGRTRKEAARFLFTRGLWLIFAELTFLHLAWTFNFNFMDVGLAVIWVTGCAMIGLSGLIFFPQIAILVISLICVLGHNLLDGHNTEWLGFWSWLHERKLLAFSVLPAIKINIIYPIIPWIVIPGLGYVFGSVFLLPQKKRANIVFALSFNCLLAFIILRYLNGYGDPSKWSQQADFIFTLLSFLNVSKYPPSLLYLLLTFGVMFLLLFFLEPLNNRFTKIISIYGKVPFFYYVLHLFLIHGFAVLIGYLRFGDVTPFMTIEWDGSYASYGYSLPIVYLIWMIVVVILYPFCKWFSDVKKRYKNNIWLSYI